MSEKIAHTLGEITSTNVRHWRTVRGMDQQALADRLATLGWSADRTTVTRIEKGARKVTVDDLGLLAVALNVPLPVLLLPVTTTDDVTLTPDRRTQSVHRWRVWEWMLGSEPLPGELEGWDGSAPLHLYEQVRAAQIELQRLQRHRVVDGPEFADALQALVDAAHMMDTAGYPAEGLIADRWADEITAREIEPSPRSRRRPPLEQLAEQLTGEES